MGIYARNLNKEWESPVYHDRYHHRLILAKLVGFLNLVLSLLFQVFTLLGDELSDEFLVVET